MKGFIKKIEKKEFEIKNGNKKGQKFSKIEFTVDVVIKDNKVKTLQGSYSFEFAKKYFTHASTINEGKKMMDYIGSEVDCVIEKRTYTKKDGATGIYEYIKFINVLDGEGNIIKLSSAKNNDDKFDF